MESDNPKGGGAVSYVCIQRHYRRLDGYNSNLEQTLSCCSKWNLLKTSKLCQSCMSLHRDRYLYGHLSHTASTPVTRDDTRHLQQLSIHFCVSSPKIDPPSSLRLALLPRPLFPLLFCNLVPTTAPNLQTLNLEAILPILLLPSRLLAWMEGAATLGKMREDTKLKRIVKMQGNRARTEGRVRKLRRGS